MKADISNTRQQWKNLKKDMYHLDDVDMYLYEGMTPAGAHKAREVLKKVLTSLNNFDSQLGKLEKELQKNKKASKTDKVAEGRRLLTQASKILNKS